MAARWRIECLVCGNKKSFHDSKDILYSKWKILAWDINDNVPICTCEKCEYIKKDK